MSHEENTTFDVDFVGPLRAYGRIIGQIVAAVVVLVGLVTALLPTKYEASAVVGPMSKGNASDGMSRAMGLASLAGISVGSGPNTQNFDRFMYLLTSPELAERLLKNRTILSIYYPGWDPDHNEWHPQSLIGKLRATLLGSAPPPDPYAFAKQLDDVITVHAIPSPDQNKVINSIYSIRLRNRDKDAAVFMLRTVINGSNEMLRQQAADTARKQSAYLENQLETVRTQEYRDTLIKLYSEQQQTLMLTNSNVPYAAEVISGDVTQSERIHKGTVKMMFVSGSLAFSLAYFFAIIRFNVRRGKKALAQLASAEL